MSNWFFVTFCRFFQIWSFWQIMSILSFLSNYVDFIKFWLFLTNANLIPLQHRYWAQVQSVQSGAARSAPSFVACSTNWRGRPPPVVRRESENAPANDNHLPFLWLENICFWQNENLTRFLTQERRVADFLFCWVSLKIA